VAWNTRNKPDWWSWSIAVKVWPFVTKVRLDSN
jgi:hypothetical protein